MVVRKACTYFTAARLGIRTVPFERLFISARPWKLQVGPRTQIVHLFCSITLSQLSYTPVENVRFIHPVDTSSSDSCECCCNRERVHHSVQYIAVLAPSSCYEESINWAVTRDRCNL